MSNVKSANVKSFVWSMSKKFYFFSIKFTEANFPSAVFGTTYLCTIVFMADTGNNRKIVNFTYSCLYASPIKVVSVDNIVRNNHWTNFLKLKFLEIAKQLLSNF